MHIIIDHFSYRLLFVITVSGVVSDLTPCTVSFVCTVKGTK